MKTLVRSILLASLLAALTATAAFAGGPPEGGDFVCPVFNDGSAVGDHNPNAVEIGGGDYSIIGPDVAVPDGATNGDGTGTPGGEHSSPGDSDYTAIWSG
ncbi:MAG: hypothetical protein ACLFWD_05040 [Anaerolineales bacterium]